MPCNLERIQGAILEGDFPDYVDGFLKKVMRQMDYPLAIRSSSLLEDSVKYSFAGKYFTAFIPNNGGEKKRIDSIKSAVKQVYASTFGINAVVYREKHGLVEEKMAVIIQQLFGKQRGDAFYPSSLSTGSPSSGHGFSS